MIKRNPYRRPLFYSHVERLNGRVVSFYGFNRYTILIRSGLWLKHSLHVVSIYTNALYENYSEWFFNVAVPWILEDDLYR